MSIPTLLNSRNFGFTSCFLLALMAFQPLLAAQQPSPMTAVDILNIPTMYESSISPDGKRLAFIKGQSDWQKNKVLKNLWIVSTKGGKARQLTFDDKTKSNLAWSPDSLHLSFLSKRKNRHKANQYKAIYLLPMAGGEARRISAHQADIKTYQWNPDGHTIYFLADEPVNPSILKQLKSKDDLFAFEEARSFRHIWRLNDINVSNSPITQISQGAYFVRGFDLADDGTKIAYLRGNGHLIDDGQKAEIWLSDNDGKNAHRVTHNDYAERRIALSPDKKHILFTADVNGTGDYYYDANLFVVNSKSGKTTLLAASETFEVEDASWAKNSKSIYIQANMGVHSELWSIALNNRSNTQLTKGKHTIKHWRYDPTSNRHSMVVVRPDNPGEFAVLPGKGGKIKFVTSLNADVKHRFRLPKQKLIRWLSPDGFELEGLLSLPLDYDPKKRYALVVNAHGGPRSSDQYGQLRWRNYIPLLAANDYLYFSPNYRGGRGYGDAFMRDMVGNYFNHAHLDVMSGIDHLIEEGYADKNKLIMSGWSAGGHMTNKLITFTDRFVAASSGAGAVEWMSMYGESDVRYGRTPWFGGTPWQKNAPTETYIAASPINKLWKVKTPTIIFVGEKDVRVPPTQSLILFRALKDLGIATELYIAPREPHGFKELRHRLGKINAELAWFNKYAGKPPYAWQPVPD